MAQDTQDQELFCPPEMDYEEWFAQQVQAGPREADDPGGLISHEEVLRQLKDLRQKWATQASKLRDVA